LWNLIADVIGEGNQGADTVLLPCDTYNSFCCGQNQAARNCCETGNGTFRIAAGSVLLAESDILTTIFITSTTDKATASVSTCHSQSATSIAVIDKTSRKVEIGIGAVLGAFSLALAATVFLLFKTRRRAKSAEKIRDMNQRLLTAAQNRITELTGD
jgi:hypothetical protein